MEQRPGIFWQQRLSGTTSVVLVNSETHFCVTNRNLTISSELIGKRFRANGTQNKDLGMK